jgi:phosphoribosylformylglycinamidine synthase
VLFAIVVFPGSTCDHDVYHVAKHVLGRAARFVWHKDRDLRGADVVVLPDGFACGGGEAGAVRALASPVMDEVRRFAGRGGHVIGIGNGFQILTQAGLLPGALHDNRPAGYLCTGARLKVENAMTPWTRMYMKGELLQLPLGHQHGAFTIDDQGLERLEGSGQVVFRYVGPGGRRGEPGSNPDGSRADIAGLANPRGNVLGMMPHPERLAEAVLGGEDGRRLFESIAEAVG